jgi:hypothetical protein
VRRKKQQGRRSDYRDLVEIGASGWDLTRIRAEGHGRFVARKRVIEEDHSITLKYESSLTLSSLAMSVRRRERES